MAADGLASGLVTWLVPRVDGQRPAELMQQGAVVSGAVVLMAGEAGVRAVPAVDYVVGLAAGRRHSNPRARAPGLRRAVLIRPEELGQPQVPAMSGRPT